MAFYTNKSQLPCDQNGKAIQGAHTIVCHDAAGTVNVSPKAVSTTKIAIKAPTNAIRLWVKCDTNNLRFDENNTLDGSAADKGYAILVKDFEYQSIPVCKAGAITYFVRDSADGNLHFFFELFKRP